MASVNGCMHYVLFHKSLLLLSKVAKRIAEELRRCNQPYRYFLFGLIFSLFLISLLPSLSEFILPHLALFFLVLLGFEASGWSA